MTITWLDPAYSIITLYSNQIKLNYKLNEEYKSAQQLPPALAAQEGPIKNKKSKKSTNDIDGKSIYIYIYIYIVTYLIYLIIVPVSTQKLIENSTNGQSNQNSQSLIINKSFPKNTNAYSNSGDAAVNPCEGTRLSQQLMKVKNQTQAKPDYHPQWKLMRVISGHLGWVRCAAVEPDNKWFATGAGDRVIKVCILLEFFTDWI